MYYSVFSHSFSHTPLLVCLSVSLPLPLYLSTYLPICLSASTLLPMCLYAHLLDATSVFVCCVFSVAYCYYVRTQPVAMTHTGLLPVAAQVALCSTVLFRWVFVLLYCCIVALLYCRCCTVVLRAKYRFHLTSNSTPHPHHPHPCALQLPQ
jgi:hypothetical protein